MGTAASTRPAVAPAPAPVTTPTAFTVLAADQLEAVIPEWDACAAHPGNAFCQSPWFATTAFANGPAGRGELLVAAGRDDAGALRAVYPLWRSHARFPLLGLRTLRPVALPGQETSTIVVGDAERGAATERLAEFLLGPSAPPFDVLHVEAIDPRSALFAALVDAAHRRGMPVATGEPVSNPIARPKDGTLPGVSAHTRRDLRRVLRRARRLGHDVECREISWEWREHREAIARVTGARWGGMAPGAVAHGPLAFEFVDVLLGRLDRHFRAHAFGAFVGSELAAYVVCFRAGSEVLLWNSCLDPRFRPVGAGMLLLDHCVREVASWPGVARINFRAGTERHRRAFADDSYVVCEMAIVRAAGVRRRIALALLNGRLGAGDSGGPPPERQA